MSILYSAYYVEIVFIKKAFYEKILFIFYVKEVYGDCRGVSSSKVENDITEATTWYCGNVKICVTRNDGQNIFVHLLRDGKNILEPVKNTVKIKNLE